MEEILRQMMPEAKLPFSGSVPPARMYVLTNREKIFGAVELLDSGTLKEIGEELEGDFIVLPSSLHECIIIPAEGAAPYQKLADMVAGINMDAVSMEERLSDHVYLYDQREEHSFRIRRTETRYRSEDGTYSYEVKEFPKTAAGIRTVALPKAWFWIEEKIRSTNPCEEYIFVNAKGKRMTTNRFRRRLERVCNRLGIVKKPPHKLLKTYGSILLDKCRQQADYGADGAYGYTMH